MSAEIVNSFTVDGCQTCPALSKYRHVVTAADQQAEYYRSITSAVLRGVESEGSETAAVDAVDLLGDIDQFTDFYTRPTDTVDDLDRLAETVDCPSAGQFLALLHASVEQANTGVAFERAAIEIATQGCRGALHQETTAPEGRSFGATIITCQSPEPEANGRSIRLG